MKNPSWYKFFAAYIDGAFAASALYLSISGFVAGRASAGQIVLLGYWLLVAVLFGLASLAFLRDSPSKRTLHRCALASLVPFVVLAFGVRLA